MSESTKTLAITVTEQNFYDVGRLLAADECWGLQSPMPELRWLAADGRITKRIHLGDVLAVFA